MWDCERGLGGWARGCWRDLDWKGGGCRTRCKFCTSRKVLNSADYGQKLGAPARAEVAVIESVTLRTDLSSTWYGR